jgi:hypothetical protein
MHLRRRLILWIPALAYAGFLLAGGSSPASLVQGVNLGQDVTLGLFGGVLGFLLAVLFTLRQRRRELRAVR